MQPGGTALRSAMSTTRPRRSRCSDGGRPSRDRSRRTRSCSRRRPCSTACDRSRRSAREVLGTGSLRHGTWRGRPLPARRRRSVVRREGKPPRRQPARAPAARTRREAGARQGARRRVAVRLAHRRTRLRRGARRSSSARSRRSRSIAARRPTAGGAYQRDPVLARPRVFRAALERRGIDVSGRGRDRHRSQRGAQEARRRFRPGGSRRSCGGS